MSSSGPAGDDHTATYFADIDGDGRDEIISLRMRGENAGEIWAWHNNKGIATDTYNTGPVPIGRGWDTMLPFNIYFADLTGDGRDEIISLRLDGEIWAWRNVNGAYTAGYTVIGRGWTEEYGWQVKFGDVDNDGRAELISTLNGAVRAWRNTKGLTPDSYAGSPVTIATGFNGADTYFAEIVP
ncbi:VCBS repeat-containing protein [Lentzea sp. NPDC051838]|uniref:FG-GAP repeat domain-containing protein n=1 Tax=Lentzea sp. NPDC051838 TaxID=3154849 RepID=UPI003419A7BB